MPSIRARLSTTILVLGCCCPSWSCRGDPLPAQAEIPYPPQAAVTEPVSLVVRRYGAWRHLLGDDSLGTEDDETTELRVTSKLVTTLSEVRLEGIFRCREDDNDWTTFSGPFSETVYTAPEGYAVARIKDPASKTSYNYWKHVLGKHHSSFALPAGAHWGSLRARIDTGDNYDGGKVGFEGQLRFQVVIVPREAEPVHEEVRGVGVYAHTRGDEDMYTQPGRSTYLRLSTELLLSADRTEVLVKADFHCHEVEEDQTTYEGESTHRVYQAPPGRKILRVHQPGTYTSYEHEETIRGLTNSFFPVPARSHWSHLECRVDQWFGGDSGAVGFRGTVDFQVVLEP